MLDFDSNIDNIINLRESQKNEQEKHIKHLNKLAYEAFEVNPAGKELLSHFIAAIMIPLEEEQLKDLRFHMGTKQPFKRFLQMISDHKMNLTGVNNG